MNMELTRLLEKVRLGMVMLGGAGNPIITDIVGDSRLVTNGALFVAIPGTKVSGDAFIDAAVERGAVAVVSEHIPANCPVPWVKVDNPRRALGELGKAFWSIEVDKMVCVGITGTNGKTTTAHLFKKLMEEQGGDANVWMFGTIDYQLGTVRRPASHTTPESLEVFRLIGKAGKRPASVVMEVSSHSLALDRVGGMAYNLAILTNITQDHLDFHQTMERYYQAKKRLFTDYIKEKGIGVVNIDDAWGRRLTQELGSRSLVTFGRAEDAAVRIVNYECSWDGTAIDLIAKGKRMHFSSALRGFFNVYNMTTLVAGSVALNYDVATVERAFATVETVPGRMDRVAIKAPFAVIVDYAHTPDALANILQTSRTLTRGKLICVFGCGGDRDRGKRPLMGRAVADNADEAIVTSDNPRSEKPEAIVDEILKGLPLDFPHLVMVDRRSAIKKAIERARPGDCVVIAGKGHEEYQEIDGVRRHFSDREVVLETYVEAGSHV